MTIKEGSRLPDVTLQEGEPDKKIKITSLFEGKKGILFGVPGAFTPACAKQHLPGYVDAADKFKAAGAEVIVCVTVNDAFVAAAWADSAHAQGKVRVLADPAGEFAKATGLTLEAAPVLGTNRIKRFSAIIEDNVVKTLNVEPDGSGTSCSLATGTLEQLKKSS